MLIAFRFKNFLSFRGEAELTLISHKADKTLKGSLISAQVSSRRKISLLTAIAIYGANSAGKTNVLRAIDFMKNAVVDSQNTWKPNGGTFFRPFGAPRDPNLVGSVEAEFIVNGVRYTYGFSAKRASFVDEWLISYASGRAREVFSRKVESEKDLARDENLLSREQDIRIKWSDAFSTSSDYVHSIVKKVRGNSLFLSAAAQDNHPACTDIYNWFNNIGVQNISGTSDRSNSMETAELITKDDSAKTNVIKIMRAAEPFLHDIEVKKIDIPADTPGMEDMTDQVRERFTRDFRFMVFFIVKDGENTVRLPLEAQSKGFQKLFSITHYIIGSLNSGFPLFVDELESSIHPHLARFIVDLFQNPEINKGKSQIIFTTHDTNMLDQSLLRRDQIWFVEKKGVCSELYSLLDFSPRKDENLERGYLRGRYGAIPVLGMDLDWLNASNEKSEAQRDLDA